MRVITGSARGLRLQTPAGRDTRPTTDRVKEALFSILHFDIPGRRVLDLFAGSGQLGIEALSRGAAACTFVDQSAEAVAVIRENLRAAGLEAHAQVLCQDAFSFLVRPHETFDLVLLDPPYHSGLLRRAMEMVEPLMPMGGLLAAETDDAAGLPETVGALTQEKVYRYGKIFLAVYRQKEVNPL